MLFGGERSISQLNRGQHPAPPQHRGPGSTVAGAYLAGTAILQHPVQLGCLPPLIEGARSSQSRRPGYVCGPKERLAARRLCQPGRRPPLRALPAGSYLPQAVTPRPHIAADARIAGHIGQIKFFSFVTEVLHPPPAVPGDSEKVLLRLPKLRRARRECSTCCTARVGGGFISVGLENREGSCPTCKARLDYCYVDGGCAPAR